MSNVEITKPELDCNLKPRKNQPAAICQIPECLGLSISSPVDIFQL